MVNKMNFIFLLDEKGLSTPFLLILLHGFNFFHQISAEGGPRKSTLGEDKQITFTHLNQPLELRCPIERSDTPTFVEWTRGNKSLYMEPGYTITNKGTLKIKSVTMDHAGTYTCEGVNGYGAVPINITVIVDNPEAENVNFTAVNSNSVNRLNVFPPSIKKRSSSNFVDEVGGEATFHCVASGQPKPHIFWFKNGHLIEDTQVLTSKGKVHSTLKLKKLEKEDAGIYKCIARNKMGEDFIDYSLLVTDVPKPPRIVSVEPPEAIIKEGEPAIFWCVVNSKPELKLHIKWLKKLNKEEIGSSENEKDSPLFRSGTTMYRPLKISDDPGTDSGIYKSKLLIKNPLEEDSGTYVCLALNDKGFNFKNVTLTVRGTVLKSASRLSYFSAGGTSFVVTGIIAIVVLAVVFLAVLSYYRGKTQKDAELGRTGFNGECRNVKHSLTHIVQKGDKGSVQYPEMNDPQ